MLWLSGRGQANQKIWWELSSSGKENMRQAASGAET